jgi:hypothetical protein
VVCGVEPRWGLLNEGLSATDCAGRVSERFGFVGAGGRKVPDDGVRIGAEAEAAEGSAPIFAGSGAVAGL